MYAHDFRVRIRAIYMCVCAFSRALNILLSTSGVGERAQLGQFCLLHSPVSQIVIIIFGSVRGSDFMLNTRALCGHKVPACAYRMSFGFRRWWWTLIELERREYIKSIRVRARPTGHLMYTQKAHTHTHSLNRVFVGWVRVRAQARA